MRRYLPLAIIGAALLIAVASGLILLRSKQTTSAPVAPAVPAVPIAQETPGKPGTELPHIRGGANAPVTFEEFGDFQCLPCGALFPMLKQLEEDYGERLRVIFRHRPLHKHEHALIAARAAEAAGLQGHFWEMHDLLFENSLRWTRGIDTVAPDASPSRRLQSNVLALESEVRDVFATYAELLKLDVERFKKDLDSAEVDARVEADRARGDALGIDRTPTIYINGHLFHISSLNLDEFHAAIDAELNGKGPESAATAAQVATPTPQ